MSADEQSRNQPEAKGIASTSRSLLARLHDDESEAWERLVTLYTPLVCYWCRKLDVPEQDLADILQEVFKSVASGMKTFRKERSKDTFRGWLRVITRNKAMDHYRRQSRQPKAAGGTDAQMRWSQLQDFDGSDDDSIPEDVSGDRKEADHLLFQSALELIQNHFEKQTWQAFWRVVIDGKTPQEVAEELSMKPGTVRVAKSRVLHRLRQELGDVMD